MQPYSASRCVAYICKFNFNRVFALVGGCLVDGERRKDCEAFDAVKQTWEPLPETAEGRADPAATSNRGVDGEKG